ncbi:UNVERIFIED_CONTAM: hypothetical protein Sindi_1779700 [Sesamum indicum]
MAYRRYLESAGFSQDDHLSLNIEQRFMWMILDDNTRAPMRDDARAETQMGHWAHGLRRYFGYPYTRDQFHGITQIPEIYYDIETFIMVFLVELRPRASRRFSLARRYCEYPEPHYPSMLPGVPIEAQSEAGNNESGNTVRNPVRGSVDAPIVISYSTAPSLQSHMHIASWDAVDHVAHGDGGPALARSTLVATRCSIDMGSEVGGIGSWTDYIRRIGVQSDRGARRTVRKTAQCARRDHEDYHQIVVTVLRHTNADWETSKSNIDLISKKKPTIRAVCECQMHSFLIYRALV